MAASTKDGRERVGESRVPMALAVVVAAGLYLALPDKFRISEILLVAYPVFLLVLLLVLIIGDPGRIDREKRWLRITTGVMVAAITVAVAVSALRLVMEILVVTGTFESAGQLLATGGIIWVTAVIAFALWYWHLDCGGPAARAHGRTTSLPAFRFPEQDIDSSHYEQWYPQFVDYLSLSFNTATSFGPADVSAVRHWSKLWLMCESGISLALIGLVVASAVNQL